MLLRPLDHTTTAKPCFALTNLGRHLGASHDRGERPLRLLHGALEVVQLLLQEEASHGGREELRHALGGAVGAVGRPERVVNEQVERRRQLLGEGLKQKTKRKHPARQENSGGRVGWNVKGESRKRTGSVFIRAEIQNNTLVWGE